MEKAQQKTTIIGHLKENYRLYAIAFGIVVIAELIGTIQFSVGSALIVLYPMLFAIIISIIFGKDALGFLKKKETKKASQLVLVAISPFMAKIGVMAGANLPELVNVGPALVFQEFGTIGTMLFALPIALFLGLKREAIGATSSTNRDKDYGLICSKYGANSPEARGSLSIYIIGFLIGTTYLGLLASIVASFDFFHPLALAMASGVGSGVMMAAASSTLATIYPAYADQIVMLAGMSDMLSAITGIYFTLFISLPLVNKMYAWLEPKIGRRGKNKNISHSKSAESRVSQ